MELPLDEDTLQAVVAFMDEFYTQQEEYAAVDHPSSAATAPTNERRAPGSHPGQANAESARPKRKRDTRRKELLSLRAAVRELEQKLQALTQRNPSVAMITRPLPGGGSLWKDIAHRQRGKRAEAEAMNRSLRTLVQEQRADVSSLEQMLRNGQLNADRSLPSLLHAKPMRVHHAGTSLSEAMVVAELEATMDRMHGRTDMVLVDPRLLASSIGPQRVVQLRNIGTKGNIVEGFDTRTIPFALHLAVEAMLHNFVTSNGRMTKQPVDSLYPAAGDTIVRSFEGEINYPLVTVQCSAKAGLRLLVEPDRVVFITCMLLYPVSTSHCNTSLDGVFVRHETWHELRSHPEIGGTGTGATISRLYHVATPEVYGVNGCLGYQQKVGAVTDLVLDSIGYQLDFRYQQLENQLFGMAA